MEDIEPTTIPDKEKGEAYILEDKDYLLIRAIQELTIAMNALRLKR